MKPTFDEIADVREQMGLLRESKTDDPTDQIVNAAAKRAIWVVRHSGFMARGAPVEADVPKEAARLVLAACRQVAESTEPALSADSADSAPVQSEPE